MLKIRSIGCVLKVIIRKKMKISFGHCDLTLDPVTFTSELDLDMVVT